jgi:3-methyladenine DNA glycosylase AlkD
MDVLMRRLVSQYGPATDPERAAAMRAYMRELFPYLGIATPARRALSRQVLAGLAPPDEAGLTRVALACWALPEREYQYFACDYLRSHAGVLTPAAMPVLRRLITTKSWWDTVDELASDVVGAVVARHPELLPTMDEWVAGTDPSVGSPSASPRSSALSELWPARVAVLHQLRYKTATDTDRLFRYCTVLAGHRDFFIRKAIGWSLREFAKTDPGAVRDFVAATPELSGLSAREALKNITPRVHGATARPAVTAAPAKPRAPR